MFKEKFIDGKPVFYSDIIPELEHYFTTRESNVEDNFNLHSRYLNISGANFIHPTQTHSGNIDFTREGETDYPETDSLILTNFEQGLYLRFADCTPVILYDKKANIGAVAHAGWRGTVLKIVPNTAEKILEYTKSDLKDIYAVIGPAISDCCYKVGEEVTNGVKQSVSDYSNLIIERSDGVYIDLKEINARQLTELGVLREHIDICPYCTSCRNDLFFSYRKENGTLKRHNAVIKLKKATA